MKKLQQFNVLAFTYERLKNSNFNININLLEAERNEELIALADNECLRAIRRLTDHPFNFLGEIKLQDLLDERKHLTKQRNSEENRRRIADVNNEMRELLYVKELISIQFPNKINKSSYAKFNKNGFIINGIKYKWIICGAGHQRTNRALYCSEYIFDKLFETLNCGAKNIPIILPKYNAYMALSSSASYSMSEPRVCVIPDCEIKMTKSVDWVDCQEDVYTVETIDKELDFNLFDGMGIISPEFAQKWADELELDYLPSCWGIRSAFVKGMVCVIDFHKFSEEIAKSKTIKDIYGNEYNSDDIDIILTKSQFKLWSAYDSWEDYLLKQKKYGIGWGCPKISPKKDTDWVLANYQYLQVLNMDDDDIKKLCSETSEWIKGVSGSENGIYKILYLLGSLIRKYDAFDLWGNIQDTSLKAILLNDELINDNYMSEKIIASLRKRIKQSFLGKIIIRGNYQTRISDPYALMEWALGLPVKGLLKEHEHYMWYWNQKNVKEVVAMRSPLTWRSEAHPLNLKNTEQMQEWYKYLNSGIVYNVWGCDCMLESDADQDLDASCTTNNDVFLNRIGG